MGGRVNGGMYGRWNGVAPRELYQGRDLPVTTDFRSVIGSVVSEHMHLSQGQMKVVFPNFNVADPSLANILKT
jgi:uncharacterized protein (DUF1501 family)